MKPVSYLVSSNNVQDLGYIFMELVLLQEHKTMLVQLISFLSTLGQDKRLNVNMLLITQLLLYTMC